MKTVSRMWLPLIALGCSVAILSCGGRGSSSSSAGPIAPSSFTLGVGKSGTGTGTETSNPAGINCGATCSASFAAGTMVTLTATPDPTSTFTGWSGACTGTGTCMVTMNAAQSVTATFTLQTPPSASGTEQIVIVGHSTSTNLPTTSGAFQASFQGPSGTVDGFVTSIGLAVSGSTVTGQFTFSTFLSGSSIEQQVRDVFVDAQGNIYVTGWTAAPDFPTTAGAFQRTLKGLSDAFVAKFNAGGQLVFSTLLGGSADEVGYSLSVDPSGAIYVTGRTGSTDFPVTAGAFQTTYGGGKHDFFVAKMNPNGSGLVWATYVGGSGDDLARGRNFVDAAGNVYVQGGTDSLDFPHTPPWTFKGQGDGVVVKLSPDGKQLLYSALIGGSLGGGNISATGGLVVNSSGEAVFCGFTNANDFPTTSGAFQRTLGGNDDAFVARLSADGTTLLASTFLGGAGREECTGLDVDSAGNIVIMGETGSTNFPTQGALQPALRGSLDLFFAKLKPDLTLLVFSTYLGGSGNDGSDGGRIAFDASGNIILVGNTDSSDFPVTSNAVQKNFGGGASDAVVVKLSPDGTQLVYSTYLGGSGDDTGRSVRYRKN